ncbi:Cysteine protease ATG4 [Camellia lanceoleosa]|nr:Cysteine protease ATG4 [Camellia lanceoleosa]
MKGFQERTFNSKHCCKTYSDSPNRTSGSVCSKPESSDSKLSRTSLWSGFFLSAFSTFETHVMNGGSMRRIQERVLEIVQRGISSSTSDIWHLGLWYKISQEESSGDLAISDGLEAFVEDFSSRILLTYCKGLLSLLLETQSTRGVNWGCMLRATDACCSGIILSSLDLPADSPWRKTKAIQPLQARNGYDLLVGSWVRPYAMCHTWESLVHFKREESELEDQSFPMAIYVVSVSKGQANWTPILLLVPLVLGLDKINPSYLGVYLPCIENWYISLLSSTFAFPQSLGILGGRLGASIHCRHAR